MSKHDQDIDLERLHYAEVATERLLRGMKTRGNLTGKALKRMQLAESAMNALTAIRLGMIVAVIALAFAACGTSQPTTPDAGPLPSCTSLGCGELGDSLCTADNRCDCEMQACEGERATFKHDAGVD